MKFLIGNSVMMRVLSGSVNVELQGTFVKELDKIGKDPLPTESAMRCYWSAYRRSKSEEGRFQRKLKFPVLSEPDDNYDRNFVCVEDLRNQEICSFSVDTEQEVDFDGAVIATIVGIGSEAEIEFVEPFLENPDIEPFTV